MRVLPTITNHNCKQSILKKKSAPSLFFKPAQNAIPKKSTHCEPEGKLQMKGEPNSNGGMIAPPIVHNVISSAGQPLDAGARNFFEPKFGTDFGNVQIHNNALAHQSSKDINALTYTQGQHIVFGSGQYQPGTNAGKKLLAHELTHVMQQKDMNKSNFSLIRRKIDYTSSTDNIQDPIPLVLNIPKTQYLALTEMTMNGKVTKDESIMLSAFDVSNLKFTQNATTPGSTDVDNSNVNLNISANRILWQAPGKGNKWAGYYDRTSVPGSKTNCESGQQMYVELNGKPDSKTIYTWIINNEDDHITDLKSIIATLELYYDSMNQRQLPACSQQADCEKLYKSKFQNADKGIITFFFQKWNSLVKSHDNKDNGKHNADSKFVKNDCDKAVLETAKKFP